MTWFVATPACSKGKNELDITIPVSGVNNNMSGLRHSLAITSDAPAVKAKTKNGVQARIGGADSAAMACGTPTL